MGAIQRVVTVTCLTSTLFAFTLPAGHGQDFIGEAIGRVIVPMLGPVAERAGGEVLDGLLTRRGRGRPSPQPVPQPMPQPVYPQPTPIVRPYPQPTPVQPTYPYDGGYPLSPSLPAPVMNQGPGVAVDQRQSPSVAPPENIASFSPPAPANVALADLIYDHALRLSVRHAREVIRHEAHAIAGRLESLSANDLRSSDLRSGEANSVAPLLQAVTAIVDLTDDVPHAQQLEWIEACRSRLTELPQDALPPEEIGMIAERIRNMKNTSLLGQITRVLAVQRQRELLNQVVLAAAKSDAPRTLLPLLTGVNAGLDWVPAPEVVLPPGTPLISIFNPLTTNAEVHFAHDELGSVSLPPGELVTAYDSFVLSFQNGNGVTKRYTISSGHYQWSLDQEGWDIRKKQTVRFILNAADAPAAFEFLLDGQPQRIEPGQVLDLSADAAPRLDYRLGDGTVITKLLTPDRYLISVDPSTTDWQIVRKPDDQLGVAAESTKTRARAAWEASIDRVRQGIPVGGRTAADSSSPVGSLLDAIED